MHIKYKGFEVHGKAEELVDFIKIASAEEPKREPTIKCDGEICVGDCDNCDKDPEEPEAWADRFVREANAAKEDKPKKAKAKTARRQFDVPKMRALRDAGWTYGEIADEMGCSPNTVWNNLKKEPRKV